MKMLWRLSREAIRYKTLYVIAILSTLALTGINLAAPKVLSAMTGIVERGVDSCWLNYFDPDKLAASLGLPENEEILMVLDLGYAADGAGSLPNHENRKPLSETVVFL